MAKKSSILPSIAILLWICKTATLNAQDISKTDTKKPVKFSGGLNLQLESYSASGIPDRKKDFTWVLTGNPTVEIMGVQLPFFFLFSNYENRYFQPFNQFGVSPYYKWVKLHLGYRNIQFSPFTLAGYRMLGGGVELTPGKFRFGFMYGRLNRSTTIDSLQNANPYGFRTMATYTRVAYAVKIGVGDNRNYFDVSFLKGWDVENSLSKELRDSVMPAENKVIGLSWQTTMWKRWVWKADVGSSIYTADIHASPISDTGEKNNTREAVKHIFDINTSSQFQVAGETKLGYHGDRFGMDVVYRRIDPNYRSMGAYFFQTDVEEYRAVPYAMLDSGRLMINGSIGLQHDNLNNAKLATSNRVIGNANINYNPSPKFGTSFSYGNYGITQNPTRISSDSGLFKQVSQNFTLVPYVNLVNDHAAQNIQVVAAYMLLNSKIAGVNISSDQSTLIGTLVYSRTWLQSAVTGSVSLNYNNTILPQGDVGSYGLGIGGGMPLIHKKATLNANVTVNSNTVNDKMNGYTVNADLGGSIPIDKHNSIQVQCIYLNNNSEDNTVIQSFSELTFRIVYGFRFR